MISSFEKVFIEVNDVIDNALIMGDEKQIRQACGNLIKNSYENVRSNNIKNARISIIFKIENNFAEIYVNDNGTGIEKSIISQIIEPYFTTKVGGSGLGLAITKKIIDDHNGSIFIRPLKGSKGTSILLKFPLISK